MPGRFLSPSACGQGRCAVLGISRVLAEQVCVLPKACEVQGLLSFPCRVFVLSLSEGFEAGCGHLRFYPGKAGRTCLF